MSEDANETPVVVEAPPARTRRPQNYREIAALREALADTQRQLRELSDANAATVADLEEAERQIANQQDTVRAALDTAEHAVRPYPSAEEFRAERNERVSVFLTGAVFGAFLAVGGMLWGAR